MGTRSERNQQETGIQIDSVEANCDLIWNGARIKIIDYQQQQQQQQQQPQPTTNNQQPTTNNHQPPTTNHQPPTTNHHHHQQQQPVSGDVKRKAPPSMAIDRKRHAAPGSLPWTDCCFCWAPGASAGKRAHQKKYSKATKKILFQSKKKGGIPNSRNVFYRSFWSVLRSQALETPSPEPCWTSPGFAPKPPRPSPEPSPEPVEPDLALHQGFLEPSPEPSPEPCWTWPGSALKPPRPSPGTFSGNRNSGAQRATQSSWANLLEKMRSRCWLANRNFCKVNLSLCLSLHLFLFVALW